MKIILTLFRSLWGWISFLVILSLVAYYYSSNNEVTSQNRNVLVLPAPNVPFSLVKTGIVEIEGGIVNVSASRTGTFRSVFAKEGDRVEVGQILAEQENRDDIILVRSAELAIENAKIQSQQDQLNLKVQERDLERASIQLAQDAISQKSFDARQDSVATAKLTLQRNLNNLEKLQTELETAKLKLSQRKIYSPVSGLIIEAVVTAGEGVSADNVTTAFRIVPDAPKQVRVSIGESDLDKVYVGQRVVLGRGDGQKAGRISSIGSVFSAAETGSVGRDNTVDVIVSTDDLPLMLGQGVVVQFEKLQDQPR